MTAIARFAGQEAQPADLAHLRACGRLVGVDVERVAKREHGCYIEEMRGDFVRAWTEDLRRRRRAA